MKIDFGIDGGGAGLLNAGASVAAVLVLLTLSSVSMSGRGALNSMVVELDQIVKMVDGSRRSTGIYRSEKKCLTGPAGSNALR